MWCIGAAYGVSSDACYFDDVSSEVQYIVVLCTMALYRTTRYGISLYGLTLQSPEWHAMVWHDITFYGMISHGVI